MEYTGAGQSLYARLYYTYTNNGIIICNNISTSILHYDFRLLPLEL